MSCRLLWANISRSACKTQKSAQKIIHPSTLTIRAHRQAKPMFHGGNTSWIDQGPPASALAKGDGQWPHLGIRRPRGWDHGYVHFAGKGPIAIPKSVMDVSLCASPGNRPWRGIKGGGHPHIKRNTFWRRRSRGTPHYIVELGRECVRRRPGEEPNLSASLFHLVPH